jgi:integral membrane protein
MFRAVSLIEGVSYVVLLAVAMPLKYIAGVPEAVKLVGSIHGGLFVLFAIALLGAARDQRWALGAMSTAMIAAIMPLGAFWLERQIRTDRFPEAR